jgi:hypothetical protein
MEKEMLRKLVSRAGLLVLGVGVLIAGIGYWKTRAPQALRETSGDVPAQTEQHLATDSSQSAEASERGPASRAQFEGGHQPVAAPVEPQTPSVVPAPVPQARELIECLGQLDTKNGAITRQQAEQWKQSLKALIGHGEAAVPAIREFLEKHQDLSFAGIPGGQFLGEPSLCVALLGALGKIGGPEALSVMAQTLQTTAVPYEIAFIAQQLEQQTPGQYRQEVLSAVSETLGMAANGQLPGFDAGPLFQTLQLYGDTSAAATVERLGSQWKYYSAITLAGLADGAGVPALIRQAQDGAGETASRDFAFQMLAQVAAQYPQAGTALVEQARKGQIPDSAWRNIAAGLGSGQCGMILSPEARLGIPAAQRTKTYHLDAGNQTYYSIPLSMLPGSGEAAQRRDLIDQLLAANPGPAAAAALQTARASLTDVLARK